MRTASTQIDALLELFNEPSSSPSPTNGHKHEHEKGTRGRVPTDGTREYQLKNVWNTHHEIMRLSLIGWKSSEIARYLGISAAMVSYTLNSELCRRQLAIMQAARDIDSVDVASEIQRLAPIAIRKLEEVLSAGNNNALEVSVARDLLDRAGHSAVKRLSVNMSASLSDEDIERIKIRAADVGMLSSGTDVVEGEVVG